MYSHVHVFFQAFWNDDSEMEDLASKASAAESGEWGLLAGGGWMTASGVSLRNEAADIPVDSPDVRPADAVAAVYVPHIPGYDRVFTHVSDVAVNAPPGTICDHSYRDVWQHAWPVADFLSVIPRRLMKAMLEDVERCFIIVAVMLTTMKVTDGALQLGVVVPPHRRCRRSVFPAGSIFAGFGFKITFYTLKSVSTLRYNVHVEQHFPATLFNPFISFPKLIQILDICKCAHVDAHLVQAVTLLLAGRTSV
jgi:hypothetical protein